MNPYLRLKALTSYPPWHDKPFHLSRAEMEDPSLVIDEFFDMYNLSSLRIILKQWLDDALLSDESGVTKHVHTCLQMEKLAEAAWVLHQKEIFKVGTENEDVDDDEIDEKSAADYEEMETPKRFAKRKLFTGKEKTDPVSCFWKIFKIADPGHLKKTIDKWQAVALGNEMANYEKAAQRSDLLQFCQHLHRLTESALALVKTSQKEQQSGIDLNRPTNLKYSLLTKEFDFQLSEEELVNPEQVFKEFFSIFSLPYCRAELWDLLDSAITSNEAGFDKNGILIEYECFLALIEAGWHFNRWEKTKKKPDE